MTEQPAAKQVAGVQKRVEKLTLALGLIGTAFAAARWGKWAGLGFATGAGLAWLNYRWLKQGVTTIVPRMPDAQTGGDEGRTRAVESETKPGRAAKIVFVKFFGRYVLLLAALYAILSYSLLPAAAFFSGLFVVVAAVLAELLYELTGHKI